MSRVPEILAETERWIVLNKPAGWLTIPGRGENQDVLLDWVRERDSRAQVVHRLDRETSGVILFARTPEAHRQASLWFQKRETKKTYACLAQGTPLRPLLKIQKTIEGAPCTTQVEVKERFSAAFFASVRPLTGRRHQIRIHLAGEGHALLGDPLYGGARRIQLANGRELEIDRVALHAKSLELPSSELFEAPLPPDFEEWLSALRSEKNP